MHNDLDSQKTTWGRLVQGAYALWIKVTAPSKEIKDPENRRQARLLASLLVALLALQIVIALVQLAVDRDMVLDLWVTPLLLLVTFTLSRTRHYRLGIYLTLFFLTILQFAGMLWGPVSGPNDLFSLFVWLIPTVVLGSLLLPPRQIVYMMAAIIAATLALPLIIPGLKLIHLLIPLRYVLVIFALLLIAAAIRLRDSLRIQSQAREIALREARFHLLFDAAPDGVIVLDTQGKIVDCNPSALQLYGVGKEEFLGAQIADFVTSDSPPVFSSITSRLKQKDAIEREIQILTKDGSVVDVWRKGTPMMDESGALAGVLIYDRDVTKRKRAEAEAQQRLKEQEAIRIATQAISSSLDLQTVLFRICEQMGQALEVTSAYINGWDQTTQRSTVLAEYFSPFAGEKEKESDIGAEYIEDDPSFWDQLKANRVDISHFDSPDLTELEKMHMQVYDVKSVLYLPLSVRGQVISYAELWESRRRRAFTQEEIALCQSIAQNAAVAMENADLYQKAQVELKMRKRTERALQKAMGIAEEARGAAESANRAKSAFLANMSHELRTPLNAVLGFSQLMARDADLKPAQRENLATINRSGEHLLELINDVLELSKIEMGSIELQERSFDLHRLLQGLYEMFELRATKKRLKLVFEQAADVPKYVRADENKLRQILINLLGNAVKFTQQGAVILRVRSLDVQRVFGSWVNQDGQMPEKNSPPPDRGSAQDPAAVDIQGTCKLIFEIEDSGPGISSEELEQVFDAFVQTASGRQSHQGTGLGLPISREYARLMGGTLKIRSQVGAGTTLHLETPAMIVGRSDVETLLATRRVVGLAPGQPGCRILVVEDTTTNRRLLFELLTATGFEVREATNGQEAVDIWETWRPHLIWMDVRMPVMDGSQATQEIKARPGGQKTVIIALTASAFEEERDAILLDGFDDFVRKPFREVDIFTALDRHLNISFIFEEIARSEGERAVPDRILPAPDKVAAWLAQMPPEWLDELKQATLEGDLLNIASVIVDAHSHNAQLATALLDMANDFAHDQILEIIQQVVGE